MKKLLFFHIIILLRFLLGAKNRLLGKESLKTRGFPNYYLENGIQVKDLFSTVKNNKLTIEKKENYEVHYLPVKTFLKNRLSSKSYFSLLRKLLTLMQILLGRIHITLSPYKDFYKYTESILVKDSDINHVVKS